MPSMKQNSTIAFYTVGDTAPPLIRHLEDDNDVRMDLTGATVRIDVAHLRMDYYYAPAKRIIEEALCAVDPDQVTNRGMVTYWFKTGELAIPGSFQYSYHVYWGDGTSQHVSSRKFEPLVVRPRAGGFS